MRDGATKEKESGAAPGVGFAEDDFGALAGEAGGGPQAILPGHTAQVGLWALLATLSMLFAGFTSAYLVRRTGADWQQIRMPPILWLNTMVLLSSSVALEAARASARQQRAKALKGWLLGTTLLGLGFLGGQFLAWRQLAAQGIYVPTNPHSSFFYMLTGVHAAHLLGGILALLYALGRTRRFLSAVAKPNALRLYATYWHFVGGVWLYLFLLLFAW